MTQGLALICKTQKFIIKYFSDSLVVWRKNATNERNNRIRVYPSIVLRSYKHQREDDATQRIVLRCIVNRPSSARAQSEFSSLGGGELNCMLHDYWTWSVMYILCSQIFLQSLFVTIGSLPRNVWTYCYYDAIRPPARPIARVVVVITIWPVLRLRRCVYNISSAQCLPYLKLVFSFFYHGLPCTVPISSYPQNQYDTLHGVGSFGLFTKLATKK